MFANQEFENWLCDHEIPISTRMVNNMYKDLFAGHLSEHRGVHTEVIDIIIILFINMEANDGRIK